MRRGCRPAPLTVRTFALGGPLNDTRQIEQLDFGIVVVDDTRNAREGCEFVGSRFALGASEVRQQGGLAN